MTTTTATASAEEPKTARYKRPRQTYMLHAPKTFVQLGK